MILIIALIVMLLLTIFVSLVKRRSDSCVHCFYQLRTSHLHSFSLISMCSTPYAP